MIEEKIKENFAALQNAKKIIMRLSFFS